MPKKRKVKIIENKCSVNCKIKMYKKWKIKMYNYLSSVHHPDLQEVLASL